ncbi:magnesium chelatase [Methylobacterium variabile]|uniref:Magnesium chelatase n=1 Tax=Methylobacterium variabile TaxID=298794 RepID=A0A0J6T255_9HYPH|nr:magnesium chelatase subunit D [Methylobacterium variabile]KMO41495.1 magnesium chelatase [Methylobacterium variabile]
MTPPGPGGAGSQETRSREACSREAWSRACLAAALAALDPAGVSVTLRARPGPVREAWLERLRALLPAGAPVTRLPSGIADEALLGGLDLPVTLRTGRPVAQPGLLARSHGGVIVVPMAERLGPGLAARIAQALDTGAVDLARDGVATRHPARFGLVLLDEGEGEDEALPAALVDRAALHLDLDAVGPGAVTAGPPPSDLAAAREARPAVPQEAAATLCALAARLGIASLRAPLLALRVARLHAALAGRTAVDEPDLAAAAALVLAPRARIWPQEADEPSTEPPQPGTPDGDEAGPAGAQMAEDRVLVAAAASLPPALLARLLAGAAPRARETGAGRAGAAAPARRGRPVGARPGDPRRGRLALVATLWAAAPWQRLRRGDGEARLRITADDLRIHRLVQRRETTTIFAVDASGSAALERLAEAKGAVELLLAECYVRRDRVALVAFRGRGADLLLVPTRSLVRAKRALASLPGGGGTPLAAGIGAAAQLASLERRAGRSPIVILLTDGRANVARSGLPGRAQAGADALAAARVLATDGTRALVIDTAVHPQDGARRLAEAMAARYLPMPQADAARLTRAVRDAAPPG